jgi:hypothetical protein
VPRVILIAWDGADWRILDLLLEQAPCRTSRPSSRRASVRCSARLSHALLVGLALPDRRRPDDHGVHDILDTKPGTHKHYPVTYRSIKVPGRPQAARVAAPSLLR